MKIILAIVLLCLSLCVNAQDSTSIEFLKPHSSYRNIVQGQFDYNYNPASTFADAMSLNNGHRFSAVGLGLKHHALEISYVRILPQDIQLKDSSTARLAGYDFNFHFGMHLIKKDKVFETNFYIGFGFGKTKLVQNYIADLYHLNTKILLEQCFYFYPKKDGLGFTFGVRGGYLYSPYRFKWNYTGGESKDFDPVNYQGYILNAFIGIDLGYLMPTD